MKLSNILIAVPALGLALVVSIANRGAVTFSIDPFSAQTPALAFAVPLYLLIFVALLIGVLIGGMSAWAGQTGWRKKARKTAKEVKHLTKDLKRSQAVEAKNGEPKSGDPERGATKAQKRLT